MTRVEMGLLGAYNNDKRSPFETFYVGGDGMSGYSTGYAEETIGLRGYENGSISYSSAYEAMMRGKTISSYNSYAYDRFTLELRYPFMLGNTTIYGLGFVEGGNAWANAKDFNPFYLPADGRTDGYRLGLWLRQRLYQPERRTVARWQQLPLHPRTGVLIKPNNDINVKEVYNLKR